MNIMFLAPLFLSPLPLALCAQFRNLHFQGVSTDFGRRYGFFVLLYYSRSSGSVGDVVSGCSVAETLHSSSADFSLGLTLNGEKWNALNFIAVEVVIACGGIVLSLFLRFVAFLLLLTCRDGNFPSGTFSNRLVFCNMDDNSLLPFPAAAA